MLPICISNYRQHEPFLCGHTQTAATHEISTKELTKKKPKTKSNERCQCDEQSRLWANQTRNV